MKRIRYSPDVDALLIELSDEPIAYAEDEGSLIIHYSPSGDVVTIEVLDVKEFMAKDSTAKVSFEN
ncbi:MULTISPECIES: DUF2283 domain-containing protein [Arthrospira]|jgi:uncharacterized protein YuzE|uniref:DUF2283 domain-containing protein n=1 Tax=Limnospira platensis NIES-46 TaxID=1236695 RepID=A0A5M3SY47_LIMPL|nr:DUF2283 domain-containing protein [Arthrospira platensis]AMW29674.1 hypothetical protein AP285_18795 [Arthrospira platensis YZ]KDR55770.1 hypothetical protein APPUASWS_020495 [Arthrospira platensis str. Paraca]MBD2668139.1 DUF2283 domain-containing protein [Arthrospira platensis FACHB-439]MBD2708698.1 DUF2283 domain-containing protein [Arthrospira platensis FACHB-835]MDF2212352.1 DUF2283 domain-containing protein [Arthrospira platensis NCB002]MDT9181555.1 DUF2283 domain-containing protein 